MVSEQTKQRLFDDLAAYFRESAPAYALESVFLYGSWASGYPHAESDVDLAVLFQDPELPEEEAFDRVLAMEAALSARLQREVTILQLHWDFRKPMLYYNAIIHGEPLYIRDRDRLIDLRNGALVQMEDYSLFGIPWQMELAERNLEGLNRV